MIKPACPRCEVGLERRTTHKVFQYVCPKAHGFAVEFPSLTKIVPPEDVREMWKASADTPIGQVRCTHCRQPMHTLYHDHDNNDATKELELDLCRRCEVLWIDTREWD